MAYRTLVNAEQKILTETIKYGFEHGISNISTKKLAPLCDCSDFTIFERFKTKQGLIDAAAKKIDRSIMKLTTDFLGENKKFSELWDIVFDYCLNHKEESIFYFEYVNLFGFDPTETNARAEEFLKVARSLFSDKQHLSDHQILILWDYATTMVFYYCEKIIHGYIPNDDANKSFIKNLVIATLNSL